MALKVKFIGEEYSFPEDILEYIFMLNLVEDMQNSLMSSIYNKVSASSMSAIDDSELHDEMRKQASRIIERLCNNGIFSKTIDEYVFENKGYEQYCLVNKNAREAMIRFLSEQMADFQKGLEHAYENAASNITGSGVHVFSSSALTLAATSAMEYSILKKQCKQADSQYQAEISTLAQQGTSRSEKQRSAYLSKIYFPEMENALYLFVYSMLDRYISDLTVEGMFNSETLKYVDLKKSSALLQNLTVTNNRKAVLKEAFVVCPFNSQVYISTIDAGLMDNATFETSRIFKQNESILDEIANRLPRIDYPCNLTTLLQNHEKNLSILEHYSSEGKDIITRLTTPYKNAVVAQYNQLKLLITDPDTCVNYILQLLQQNSPNYDDITLTNLAMSLVNNVISTQDFDTLVSICGFTNLIYEILPTDQCIESVPSKNNIDNFYIKKIADNFRFLLDKRKAQIDEEKAQNAEKLRQTVAQKQNLRKIGIYCAIASIVVAIVSVIYISLLPQNNELSTGTNTTTATTNLANPDIDNETTSNITTPSASEHNIGFITEEKPSIIIDTNLPVDFLDYRYWLGTDCSFLGISRERVDEGEYDIEVGEAEFFDHKGIVSVVVTPRNYEAFRFFFQPYDAYTDKELQTIQVELETIFGTPSDNSQNKSSYIDYDNCARYCFGLPTILDTESFCVLDWNWENIMKRQYHIDEPSCIREPSLGMTTDEVINSVWGKPLELNKNYANNPQFEEWVYSFDRYIYFNNGVATMVIE